MRIAKERADAYKPQRFREEAPIKPAPLPAGARHTGYAQPTRASRASERADAYIRDTK